MYMCMCTCVYVCLCVCWWVGVRGCAYVYVCVACVCVVYEWCVYVCVHVCMCVVLCVCMEGYGWLVGRLVVRSVGAFVDRFGGCGVCMCVEGQLSVCVRVHLCTCVHVCMCVLCMRVYVCMCIFRERAYVHTHTRSRRPKYALPRFRILICVSCCSAGANAIASFGPSLFPAARCMDLCVCLGTRARPVWLSPMAVSDNCHKSPSPPPQIIPCCNTNTHVHTHTHTIHTQHAHTDVHTCTQMHTHAYG